MSGTCEEVESATPRACWNPSSCNNDIKWISNAKVTQVEDGKMFVSGDG